jgi:hypothetical protein
MSQQKKPKPSGSYSPKCVEWAFSEVGQQQCAKRCKIHRGFIVACYRGGVGQL